MEIQLVPSSASPTVNGNQINGHVGPLALDVNGHFTVNLFDNTVISPGGTQYQFTVRNPGVQPPVGTGPVAFVVTLTISGASQDISASLAGSALALSRTEGGVLPNSIVTPYLVQGSDINKCLYTNATNNGVITVPDAGTGLFRNGANWCLHNNVTNLGGDTIVNTSASKFDVNVPGIGTIPNLVKFVVPAGGSAYFYQESNNNWQVNLSTSAGFVQASIFPGTGSGDCGDAVKQALASLPNSTGIVTVDQRCGILPLAFNTPFTVGQNEQVQFTTGGTWAVCGQVTVSGAFGLGMPGAIGGLFPSDNGPVILRQASGCNLAPMILLTGGQATMMHITIDGNAAQNGTGGDCIDTSVNTPRPLFEQIQVTNCPRDGLELLGAGGTTAVPIITDSVFNNNVRHGIFCNQVLDPVIQMGNVIDGNGLEGIHSVDCPGGKVGAGNDFTNNTEYGIYLGSTNGGLTSSGWTIVNSNFSGQNADIAVDGTFAIGQEIIVGNIFAGQDSARVNNAVPDVYLHNSLGDTVVGNSFVVGNGAHAASFAVQHDSTGTATSATIGPNSTFGTFGTGIYAPLSGDVVDGAANTASAPTNFGVALGAQTVLGKTQFSGGAIVNISMVQSVAGVGCGAGSNTVTPTLAWTGPGGNAKTLALTALSMSANGAVDTVQTDTQGISVNGGTAITFTTASTLASAGCGTIPRYIVYATVSGQ